MDELIEFLLARLDEDEAAVHSMMESAADEPQLITHRPLQTWVREHPSDAIGEVAQRVLADVGAKRRIVEDYETYHREYREGPSPFAEGRRFAALLAVSRVAEAFANHPDYDERWRP